jgi:hypothetical protein
MSIRNLFLQVMPGRKTDEQRDDLGRVEKDGILKSSDGHGFRSLAPGILKEKLGYLHEIADRQLAHAPKSSTDRAYALPNFYLRVRS